MPSEAPQFGGQPGPRGPKRRRRRPRRRKTRRAQYDEKACLHDERNHGSDTARPPPLILARLSPITTSETPRSATSLTRNEPAPLSAGKPPAAGSQIGMAKSSDVV